jgi:hypothetical protein
MKIKRRGRGKKMEKMEKKEGETFLPYFQFRFTIQLGFLPWNIRKIQKKMVKIYDKYGRKVS